MDNGLFDIMGYKPEELTCRDCSAKFCVHYDSGKTFWYCELRYSGLTNNGYRKIKLKDYSCELIKKVDKKA
jgi:hypothetical protein